MRITFCLLLFVSALNGQTISLDSQLVVAQQRLDSMYEAGDEMDVYAFCLATLARAQAVADPKLRARAHNLLASWHFYSVKSEVPDSFLRYDSLYVENLLQTDDSVAIARAYHQLAADNWTGLRLREAETATAESIRRYRELGDNPAAARGEMMLAGLYTELEEYEAAENMFKRAEASFPEQPSIYPKIQMLKSWAELCMETGQFERALEMMQAMMTEYGPQIQAADSDVSYAGMLAVRGRAYLKNRQPGEAMADFRQAWELIKGVVEFEKEADGWKQDIGEVHYFRGEYAASIPWLSAGISHLIRKGRKSKGMEENMRHLSDAYARVGEPDSAVHYLRLATDQYTDRLEQRLASMNSELRVRYASERKDALIDQQASRISTQTLNQRLTFGLVGLLLLGAAGLYVGLRSNRRKNSLLEQRNAENETLLKEIHHRVKNNLEVVSSLLELQSVDLADEGARDAMLAGRSRVSTMGILHQKLYRGDHLGTVGMREYFQDLTRNLGHTFGVIDRVDFRVDVPEELRLDIDTAVPLGLIANELITNSVKYAFPGAAAGAVTVEMSRVGEHWSLAVSDNGRGKTQLPSQGTGFGTRLVKMLVQQLEGELREVNEGGLRTEVRFGA